MKPIFVCFAGPSLGSVELSTVPSLIDFQPPAAAGDILNYIIKNPTTKCIILADGYYFSNLSPLHRELQIALKSNIRVIGCSSMGALRATELSCDGMEGYGHVYEYFKKHSFTPDDEVGLLHSYKSDNYVHLSIPLVNFRLLLKKSRSKRLKKLLCHILPILESLPFYLRTWNYVSHALAAYSDDSDSDFSFLQDKYIDYKSLDLANLLSSLSCMPDKCEFDYTQVDLSVVYEDIYSGEFRAGSYVLAPYRHLGFDCAEIVLTELNLRDLIICFNSHHQITSKMVFNELLLREALSNNIQVSVSEIEAYMNSLIAVYCVNTPYDLCPILCLALYELICFCYLSCMLKKTLDLLAQHLLRGINIQPFSHVVRSMSILPHQLNALEYSILSDCTGVLQCLNDSNKSFMIQQLIAAHKIPHPFTPLTNHHISDHDKRTKFKIDRHELVEIYQRLSRLNQDFF